jgi:hypothetical protein
VEEGAVEEVGEEQAPNPSWVETQQKAPIGTASLMTDSVPPDDFPN